MCGLIAWIGAVPSDIEEIARIAGGRGPHQHGYVTISDTMERRTARGPLTGPFAGSFTIGHSRLATSGSRPGTLPDLDEAQPYVQNGLALAHNGVIHLEENNQYLQTVDSKMLFEVDDPHEFLEFHHNEYAHNHALITADMETMVVSSFGHPLHIRETDEGLVVSSVPTDNGEWEKVFGTISFTMIGGGEN